MTKGVSLPEILLLVKNQGFLYPKAVRFSFEGEDSLFIITALPYPALGPHDLSKEDDPHGLIAPFARRNYYLTAVGLLKEIIREIRTLSNLKKGDFRIFCNSRLPEKDMAASAKLGSYGKNSLLLTREFGSLCIIAGFSMPLNSFSESTYVKNTFPLLTKIKENRKRYISPVCASCSACIKACPAGAIKRDGTFIKEKCIQYLATSLESIPHRIMENWGAVLYGCQRCQIVCPANNPSMEQNPVPESVFPQSGNIGPSISLRLILGSPLRIKEIIKGTAFDRRWIPTEALLRNALIAAGNKKGESLLPLIEPYLSDNREYLRHAALWAHRKITAG